MRTRIALLVLIGMTLVGCVSSGGLAPTNGAAEAIQEAPPASADASAEASGPYGNAPAAIPGTLEAENYDTGGSGVAYTVGSVNGTANRYRSDGVDLEATAASGGGFNLGWTSAGQWFRYTVKVATASTYTVSFEVAAPSAVTGAFHLSGSAGASLSARVNVPATGNWQAWQTVTATVTLPAGQQVLTLTEDNAGWNLNKATFALAQSGGNGPSGSVACGGPPDGTDRCMLPYYRMRVEYLDQGDWTDLTVTDPEKVIKVKELSMAGTPIVHVVDKQHIGVNTQYGKDLKVIVDYALTTGAINSPFAFKITKGGAGTVTARISTVVGDTVTLVKEINKQAGALSFTVDLSSLKGVTPTQAPIVDVPRMGMALYYPWYSLSSWSSPVLIDKPRTPYASNNPADVGRQMDQAKSAGINSFVVSWTGPGTQSDKNFAMMLDQAKGRGFKVGIFLEIHKDDGPPRAASELISWLNYLTSTYQNHPALLKVHGQLFVVPYLSDDIPLDTWKTIRAGVRNAGHDVWLVEDRQNLDFLDVFDGMWFDSTFTALGPEVRYWSVLADNPAPKMWIPTVNPGVDDRRVPGRNPTQYIDREGGNRMRRMLAASLTSEPNWVVVHTWNEWWENTYIEPSVNFGTQYLDMTGQYLLPWINKTQ
jgi:Glycosyl hydrolase family 99/Carbohydrate binding module (family 6)